MTDRDFRYELPDGEVVEAFQLHEGSRYQEDLWPDWFNSRMFVTSENEGGAKTHYLKIGEAETEIPEYGWLLRNERGTIRVVDYTVMEKAVKVVREVPKIPDVAKPMGDQALQLAAKMTKRPFDEVKAEDQANVEQANRNRQKMIDSLHPDDAEALGLKQTGSPEIALVETFPDDEPVMGDQFPDDYEPDPMEVPRGIGKAAPVPIVREIDGDLFDEIKDVYRLWDEGEEGEAKRLLKQSLSSRTNWCNCAPGMCDGDRDQWECRQNSLLARP